MPGGGTAIVCGDRPRPPKLCLWCARPHTRLCDFPIRTVTNNPSAMSAAALDAGAASEETVRTRNAQMCTQHATRIGPDIDYCPDHKGKRPEL